MSERWALCDRCRRWFYVQRASASDELHCPVCHAAPSLVQERQPETTQPA